MPSAAPASPHANGPWIDVCIDCLQALRRKRVPRLSLVRFDVGAVELPELTYVEQQIIALLRPQQAVVYVGSARAPPGGRMLAARGNMVLHVAPGPAATLQVFPLPPATLPDTITVVLTDAVRDIDEARARLAQLPLLHARGSVLRQWLQHLVPLYLAKGWVLPANAQGSNAAAAPRLSYENVRVVEELSSVPEALVAAALTTSDVEQAAYVAAAVGADREGPAAARFGSAVEAAAAAAEAAQAAAGAAPEQAQPEDGAAAASSAVAAARFAAGDDGVDEVELIVPAEGDAAVDAEETAAAAARAAPTAEALLAQGGILVSPAQRNAIFFDYDASWPARAYPSLFPLGTGTRPPLPPRGGGATAAAGGSGPTEREHAAALLMRSSRKHACAAPWLLAQLNVLRRHAAHTASAVQLRVSPRTRAGLEGVTEADVDACLAFLARGLRGRARADALAAAPPRVRALLDAVNIAGPRVTGAPAAFAALRAVAFALWYAAGAFTCMVNINPSETEARLFAALAGAPYACDGPDGAPDARRLPPLQRWQLAARNPEASATFFWCTLHGALRAAFGWDGAAWQQRTTRCVFGLVAAWFAKFESSTRSAIHAHSCVTAVQLRPERLRLLQQHGSAPYIEWLESLSCAHLPPGLRLAAEDAAEPGGDWDALLAADEPVGAANAAGSSDSAAANAAPPALAPRAATTAPGSNTAAAPPAAPAPHIAAAQPTVGSSSRSDAPPAPAVAVQAYADGARAAAHEPPLAAMTGIAVALANARLQRELQPHKHTHTCAKHGYAGTDCSCRLALPLPRRRRTTFSPATGQICLRRDYAMLVPCAPALLLALRCNMAIYLFASTALHDRAQALWRQAVAARGREAAGPPPEPIDVESAAADGAEYGAKYSSKDDSTGSAEPPLRAARALAVAPQPGFASAADAATRAARRALSIALIAAMRAQLISELTRRLRASVAAAAPNGELAANAADDTGADASAERAALGVEKEAYAAAVLSVFTPWRPAAPPAAAAAATAGRDAADATPLWDALQAAQLPAVLRRVLDNVSTHARARERRAATDAQKRRAREVAALLADAQASDAAPPPDTSGSSSSGEDAAEAWDAPRAAAQAAAAEAAAAAEDVILIGANAPAADTGTGPEIAATDLQGTAPPPPHVVIADSADAQRRRAAAKHALIAEDKAYTATLDARAAAARAGDGSVLTVTAGAADAPPAVLLLSAAEVAAAMAAGRAPVPRPLGAHETPPFVRNARTISPADAARAWRLAPDQHFAFRLVTAALLDVIDARPRPPLRMVLTGEPGAGKSHTLHAVLWFALQHGCDGLFRVAAYTWRAAAEASTPTAPGVSTTRLFRLNPTTNAPVSSSTARAEATTALAPPVAFVIFDELSLLSQQHLWGCHRVAADVRAPPASAEDGSAAPPTAAAAGVRSSRSSHSRAPAQGSAAAAAASAAAAAGAPAPEPFGSLHVILAGDPDQHETITGTPLWTRTALERRAPAAAHDAAATPTNGRELYASFATVVQLRSQQRAAPTASGQQLYRWWRAFAQRDGADRATVEELCDHLQASVVTNWAPLVAGGVRVVVLRNSQHASLNLRLAYADARRRQTQPCLWAAEDQLANVPNDAAPGAATALRRAALALPTSSTQQLPGLCVFFPGVQLLCTDSDLPLAGRFKNNACEGVALVLDEREPADVRLQGGVRVLSYPPAALVVRPASERTSAAGHAAWDWVPPGCLVIEPKTQTLKITLPVARAAGGVQDAQLRLKRRALPLDLAYCTTDFFCQGLSFKENPWVADLAPPPTGAISRPNVYVVLSRHPDADRLRALQPLWDPQQPGAREHLIARFMRASRMTDDLRAEHDRLAAAAAATRAAHAALAAEVGCAN